MANTFITAAGIARAAYAALYNQTVMLPLVHRDLSAEFTAQKRGNTVMIKKPAVFEALDFDRAVGIQPQDITEGSIPVTLDHISDVSVVVTTEQMTLSVEDFAEEVVNPAMEAISQKVDKALLALRADVTQKVGVASGYEWSKPEALIDAGRILDTNAVPATNRIAVVGPTTKASWLNTDLLKHADKSGSTEALRNGSIGRDLFGFETYWSQNVGQPAANPTSGQPTTEVDLAFHQSAFAFVSAPLEVPPGSGAVVISYKGLSVRVVYGYDQKYKQTVVSFDTLYGVKTLDPKRAVKIQGALQA